MRRLQWLVPALALVLLASSPGACPDLDMGPVEARIVSGPDEDGELLISIKVDVANRSDSEVALSLDIQALDGEGFEVFESHLAGKVGPNTFETITDTDYIEKDVYESISRWRIDE